VSELHPAENRGYRELYAFARQLEAYWPKLAERLAGSSAERPLRDGAAAATVLIAELEGKTPEYGLYGKPAAQSLGSNLARARRDVRDRFLERNQALRTAVLDVQHVVTLLGYQAQLAETRGDAELATVLKRHEKELASSERAARRAAVRLGTAPDAAIERLDPSPAGRVAHGAANAFGTVGEWVDRQRGSAD
jgi:hypothetical protein